MKAEAERTRTTLRQELEALREEVDSARRDVLQQRGELDGVAGRVACLEKRQDVVEAGWGATRDQVSSELAAVTARVDAVQRELYDRISVVQSRPSSVVHVDERASVSGSLPSGKMRAKPNSYDGKISFPLYRVQFDMVAELNCWSDIEKARHLAASLQGQALTVLTTLSAADRIDYQRLCAVLSDRFDQNRSAELALVKLDNRRRNARESLQSYSADVEQLVLFAYPAVNSDTRDVMTRDRFLRGLDSELRKQVKLSRPVTYMDTLNVALEIESVLVSEADAGQDRSNRRAVRRVSGRVDDSDSEPTSSRRDMSKITCFNCRKTGHYKNQCNEPARDEAAGGGRSRNHASRKRRLSHSGSRRQPPRSSQSRQPDDRQSDDESRDETIAALRAGLDRLVASDSRPRSRQVSDSPKNSH